MRYPTNNWSKEEPRCYAEIVTYITTRNSERIHIIGQREKLKR